MMNDAARLTLRSIALVALGAIVGPASAAAPLRVVGTLQHYASLAREIGGERVEARAIVPADADAHFIKPKPSYALMLRRADLLIATGLDLELWLDVLQRKAGNRRIVPGADGYVAASAGVPLLDRARDLSRSAGDIHIYGNPHIQTSPPNLRRIASNIAAGLCRIDAGHCGEYQARLEEFKLRLDQRTYGADLVAEFGGDFLDQKAAAGELLAWLEDRGLDDRLHGWLGRGRAFRGRRIVCFHRNWSYLASFFGLEVVDTVEPKPGIPPSARHVSELMQEISSQGVEVLLASNTYEIGKTRRIAERTGVRAVVVPITTGGAPGVETVIDLVERWVASLEQAFGAVDGDDR